MASRGSWVLKAAINLGLAVAGLFAVSAAASAATMTFGSGNASIGLCCTLPPYVEDGIIATPTPAPLTSLPGETHFDISDLALYGGSPGDSVGVIHRGNGGEQVTFTFAGGNFDLHSIDITGWDLDGDPSLSGVFESSSGATVNVSDPTLLSIDFAALSGWSNISFFTFTVPVGVATCSAVVNCAGVGFDNVVMTTPGTVPIPATLPLFVIALAGLGWFASRRKRAA